MTLRIAVGGSATDPFHNGHLNVLKNVLSSGLFDKVIWYPSGFSNHKPDITISEHRAIMAMLGVPQRWLCRPTSEWAKLELRLEDVYGNDVPTFIRILTLQQQYKGASVTFFTGSDAVTRKDNTSPLPLETWHHADRLMMENILLLPRKGFAQPKDVDLSPNFTWLPKGTGEISSSNIRKMITDGNDYWENLVPKKVRDYIKLHKLYSKG